MWYDSPWFILGIIGGCVALFAVPMTIADRRREKRHAARAAERHSYRGHVVAVVDGDIFLNSDHQKVVTHSRDLRLQIGKEYEIILDGNKDIVDISIVGD